MVFVEACFIVAETKARKLTEIWNLGSLIYRLGLAHSLRNHFIKELRIKPLNKEGLLCLRTILEDINYYEYDTYVPHSSLFQKEDLVFGGPFSANDLVYGQPLNEIREPSVFVDSTYDF